MGFFTDTMTVYNHHTDPDTGQDVWNRNVVNGIQWTHGKRKIDVVNGVATESTVESITVDFRGRYKGRKGYLNPVEYAGLPPGRMADYWTLDQESGMDYLVLGECGIDIRKPSELKTFQYHGVITSVADHRNRPGLKHIRVVVK